MTVELLGLRRIDFGQPPQAQAWCGPSFRSVPVYAVWCEAPLQQAVTQLAAERWGCPVCLMPWNLARANGVIARVTSTKNCGTVSDSCGNCGACVYFDTTPAEERAGLTWTKTIAEGRG